MNTKTPEIEFPLVDCEKHGIQRGWMLCNHVLCQSFPPGIFVRPTEVATGLAMCLDCAETLTKLRDKDPLPVSVRIICEAHVAEMLQDIRSSTERFMAELNKPLEVIIN